MNNIDQPLVVAISSRTLFNMNDSHQTFVQQGVDAYARYQIQHEDTPLEPGEAFHLIRKLLNLNTLSGQKLVEVILLSRNSGDSGLRVFNSIRHYGLDIERAAFCGGRDPWRYVKAFNGQLFLSMDDNDVRHALNLGVAACLLYTSDAADD